MKDEHAMEGPPVVLVHGWNGWPGNWGPIAKGLRRAGWQPFTPRLPVRPLRETVAYDARLLADFMARTDYGGRPLAAQPVALVGYSRGGLVIRTYLCQYGSKRTRGVVHIGTPHLGCPWGSLKLLRPVAGLLEMQAKSEFLNWLNANPEPECPTLAICGRASELHGYNDLVVWEESATMGGRIPAVTVDMRPTTEAWHGNLINRAWTHIPAPNLGRSDRVWPQTLNHLLRFLQGLT